MKTFLHLALFLFTIALQGQVTIDQSNFLRGTTYTDTLANAMPSTLGTPSEGANQVWDYSALVAADFEYEEHFGVNNHPDFPTATSYYQNDLIFQGFVIQNFNYEAVDASGWSIVGQEIKNITYPIAAITGGPTDSLHFVGGNFAYPVPSDLLNFPMTYQDQWTTEITGNTPFELTVAAFGLNKTPGYRKRTVTTTREVVGYGELTIPTLDGTPSAPMEVLLMKSFTSAVDSVFLGGAPAPAPLMAAFGLTQGSTASSLDYLFYKPGFGSAVLFYSPDEPGEFSFRPQAAEVVSGVREAKLMQVRHFPNPVVSGQTLTIEMESPIANGLVRLIDMQGKLVMETTFDNSFGQTVQLQTPNGTRAGLYLYQIQDLDNGGVGMGKLQIQ
ncbi:MAG: T9SS type A sorting domain-containing protein [Saprospiraceae bacterium]